MDRTVRDYHPTIGRTGRDIDDLIQGTAFFPGGCGLWCGAELGGEMPDAFPVAPIMLVAHNFDSISSFERSKACGGEADSFLWRDVLVPLVTAANIELGNVFFSNALMGCKPGSATGDMPSVPGYEDQCREFLAKQIEIVEPRIVVALGEKARTRLQKVEPGAQSIMHPSAREFKPGLTRANRIRAQAEILARLTS
jgi:hypothetical protein